MNESDLKSALKEWDDVFSGKPKSVPKQEQADEFEW